MFAEELVATGALVLGVVWSTDAALFAHGLTEGVVEGRRVSDAALTGRARRRRRVDVARYLAALQPYRSYCA